MNHEGKPILVGPVSNGSFRPHIVAENTETYGLADVVAKALAGNAAYRVTHMYMEFINDTVPSLTASKSTTREYYTSLSGRDYLRVPVVALSFTSTDEEKYSHNRVWFFGESSGSLGRLGSPFTQAASSRVFGGALVCSPTGDEVDDIVVAHFYFENQAYSPKLNNNNVGVRWPAIFK
jgi:hypothetical protein